MIANSPNGTVPPRRGAFLQIAGSVRCPTPFLGVNDAHFISTEVIYEKLAGTWLAITITFDE